MGLLCLRLHSIIVGRICHYDKRAQACARPGSGDLQDIYHRRRLLDLPVVFVPHRLGAFRGRECDRAGLGSDLLRNIGRLDQTGVWRTPFVEPS